jgi:protein-disulfide isomerase
MKKIMITLMFLFVSTQMVAAEVQTPEQEQRAQKIVYDFLFNDPNSPRIGAKNPKLTLVVFTDYNCPYCKKFDPYLERSSRNIRMWRWSLSFCLTGQKVR